MEERDKKQYKDFPRVLVVRTVCFYGRGTGWSLLGKKILQVTRKGQKKKETAQYMT